MRFIGYAVIAVGVILGVAAGLAATWFFLVGGILDLAHGPVLSSAVDRVDEWNREYADRWGRLRLGLVKVFILEPLALLVVALATRGLVRLGRTLVHRRATVPPEPVPPPPPAPTVPPAEPLPAAPRPAWKEPESWEVPPLPSAIAPVPTSEPERELPPSAPEPEPAAATASAATIPLRTLADDTVLEVTLLDVLDPVDPPPADPSDPRFVAVLLELHNAAGGAFEDLPTGGAVVVGTDGERYRTAAQRLEPSLREVRLEPGERRKGYLSFKLPAGIGPAGFRFTPNLGLAPHTGEWSLGPAGASRAGTPQD